MKDILALLVLASVLFADIGPPPAAPDITVMLIKGGQNYTGPMTLIYHCEAPEMGGNDSPVADREMGLDCGNGVCRSNGWFYKFNPCYYSQGGYFTYNTTGSDALIKVNGNVTFPSGGKYDFTIDMDSGSIKPSRGDGNPPACPLPALFLPALLGLALFAGKGAWN